MAVVVALAVMAAGEGGAITEVEEVGASMEAAVAGVLAAATAAEVVVEDLIAAAEVEVHTVEAAAIRIAKLCESPW